MATIIPTDKIPPTLRYAITRDAVVRFIANRATFKIPPTGAVKWKPVAVVT
eukprot:CAMPEP_0196129470 /NCGR_PEP_ID=MMETSP0910-20130528/97_1 /TAXON_ID=49265 /ORGANISM="Thalassiosira rotula, Strain GSO102" /LENGTH=50 /DNA_ID=CAMNT_0041388571 /DNA_START=150 /DNA_END=302 /DNA_ORIENTATION=+